MSSTAVPASSITLSLDNANAPSPRYGKPDAPVETMASITAQLNQLSDRQLVQVVDAVKARGVIVRGNCYTRDDIGRFNRDNVSIILQDEYWSDFHTSACSWEKDRGFIHDLLEDYATATDEEPDDSDSEYPDTDSQRERVLKSAVDRDAASIIETSTATPILHVSCLEDPEIAGRVDAFVNGEGRSQGYPGWDYDILGLHGVRQMLSIHECGAWDDNDEELIRVLDAHPGLRTVQKRGSCRRQWVAWDDDSYRGNAHVDRTVYIVHEKEEVLCDQDCEECADISRNWARREDF
jgi:hypothetical protein